MEKKIFIKKNSFNENSFLSTNSNYNQNGVQFKENSNKHLYSLSHDTATGDLKIRAVLILTAISLFLYEMSIPHIFKENLLELNRNVQMYLDDTWTWANEPDHRYKLVSVLCGLVLSIFSCFVIYFDSNIPGMDPPSPFSPNSKRKYRHQRGSSIHLGYITAISSGIIVTGLMLYNF